MAIYLNVIEQRNGIRQRNLTFLLTQKRMSSAKADEYLFHMKRDRNLGYVRMAIKNALFCTKNSVNARF